MTKLQASLGDCRVIGLPTVTDARGSLSFLEGTRHVPFAFARVFYLHGLPPGASRGAHAHLQCEQFLIPMSGALTVCLDDGRDRLDVRLESPTAGLYVPPMIWATERHFAAETVCAVFASHQYDSEDYIRDYDSFVALRKEGR